MEELDAIVLQIQHRHPNAGCRINIWVTVSDPGQLCSTLKEVKSVCVLTPFLFVKTHFVCALTQGDSSHLAGCTVEVTALHPPSPFHKYTPPPETPPSVDADTSINPPLCCCTNVLHLYTQLRSFRHNAPSLSGSGGSERRGATRSGLGEQTPFGRKGAHRASEDGARIWVELCCCGAAAEGDAAPAGLRAPRSPPARLVMPAARGSPPSSRRRRTEESRLGW
ncbi:hypothetical protein FQA47_011417 [Oryzias melastigma]|uniref:Uncharacterized protein n=1 Tax=Oryzias melastigma TaxID=30732 RepID=A0A834F3P8_ORYME|nr:hypothetical protein FQA47_011417 [Oryzias melastigma]